MQQSEIKIFLLTFSIFFIITRIIDWKDTNKAKQASSRLYVSVVFIFRLFMFLWIIYGRRYLHSVDFVSGLLWPSA